MSHNTPTGLTEVANSAVVTLVGDASLTGQSYADVDYTFAPVSPKLMDRDAQIYAKVGVSKDRADPGTTDAVRMAVVPEGTRPTSSDWKTASWNSVTYTSGGKTYRYILLLVAGSAAAETGAQDVTLTPTSFPARFDVYVEVIAFPEVPVAKAGSLVVV